MHAHGSQRWSTRQRGVNLAATTSTSNVTRMASRPRLNDFIFVCSSSARFSFLSDVNGKKAGKYDPCNRKGKTGAGRQHLLHTVPKPTAFLLKLLLANNIGGICPTFGKKTFQGIPYLPTSCHLGSVPPSLSTPVLRLNDTACSTHDKCQAGNIPAPKK